MREIKLSAEIINSFDKEISQFSHIELKDCYQCGKCSASCPMIFQMDYPPNQLIRLAQLGQREEVLTSSTIWVCVSCITCTARCPKEIDIAGFMDVCRELSVKEGLATKAQSRIQKFHKSFLETIHAHGRLYELKLILKYKMRSFALMQDAFKTPKMLSTGKLKLFPHKIENIKELEKIFEDCIK